MTSHEKFDAEQIRQFCYMHYIQPARQRGEAVITLKASNIRKEIRKTFRKEGCKYPRVATVRLALRSKKFEKDYNIKLFKGVNTYLLRNNLKKLDESFRRSDADREFWLQISRESLARAYGDDEPDFQSQCDQTIQHEFEADSVIHLRSEDDVKVFLEALENPPEPNDALKEAAHSHKRFFSNA